MSFYCDVTCPYAQAVLAKMAFYILRWGDDASSSTRKALAVDVPEPVSVTLQSASKHY